MVFAVLPSPAIYPTLGRIRNWLFYGLPAGASVTLFFALSGYVLGLALIRENDYAKFVTRRLFRIFPALWVGISVTFIAEVLVAPGMPKDEFHPWFQNVFLTGPTLHGFFRNLLLQEVNIDPVIWSMAPEVIWSLALPAVAYLHFKFKLIGRLAMLAIVALAVTSIGIAIGFAALCHRFVELPGIAIGLVVYDKLKLHHDDDGVPARI